MPGKCPASFFMINSEIVLNAYLQGYFPMADEHDGEIYWHSPDPRAIFPINQIKKPRSLVKSSRKKDFKYSVNEDFEFVIRACADREDTWISEDIMKIYNELNILGHAHSVETWMNNEIVGGLYGISIGGAFFGESMFNTESDAAKAAFYYLVEHIKMRGFIVLDSQYINPFTKQLGAIEIPKKEYLELLQQALMLPVSFDS